MRVSRRAVLKLGAVAGGALVVGVHLPGCALVPGPGAMARHAAATGELKPNAWVRITPDDRIVVTLDRVEMGQGTMTSHATLIAEELEIDPARVEIEMAEADRVYDNPDRDLRFQVTGGSTSTKTSWLPLRRAGATARLLLEAGAAATWRVPRREVAARDGIVTHAASGRSARYGELVGAAARQSPPRTVPLKPASAFRWIGKEVPRLDARAKSTGTAGFGIDVRVPGMVFAVLARPPIRGSLVRAVRDAAARRIRGVRDVIALDRAVAVIADATWPAQQGAAALEIDWKPGELRRVHTPDLRAEYLDRVGERGRRVERTGDARGAIRRAQRKLSAIYEAPFLAHAAMEPMNATASVTATGAEVWAPTQASGVARALVAQALGLRQEDVLVHTTFLGGGFGRRLNADYCVEAAVVARRVGRPVQVVWTREDDLANDYYRPMMMHKLDAGLRGGRVEGWLHHVLGPSIVAHAGPDFIQALVPYRVPRASRRVIERLASAAFRLDVVPDQTSTEGATALPYDVGARRIELTTIDSGAPVGFWRSVGHSHTAFAVESFVDELAAAAGTDPVEFRRAMLPAEGMHRRVLDLAVARAGWSSAAASGVGRGIALHLSFGSCVATVIDASVDRDRVHVHRVVSVIECGLAINPAIVRSQVESAVIFGLSAALRQEITFDHGVVEQTNFHQFPLLRMHECPPIEVHVVPSEDPPQGVGEPGVPPVAPALCNAIFAATGRRIRRLPIERALREGWT